MLQGDNVNMRRFITPILRLIARTFFRRIEIVGWETVPRGPVIFAANHPNGLIDPLFLLCFVPRPVSFLAKAPLFRMPLIGLAFSRRLSRNSTMHWRLLPEPSQNARIVIRYLP
jgi:1-acyl-sn-glycerol-3-phosphate acyltransferase